MSKFYYHLTNIAPTPLTFTGGLCVGAMESVRLDTDQLLSAWPFFDAGQLLTVEAALRFIDDATEKSIQNYAAWVRMERNGVEASELRDALRARICSGIPEIEHFGLPDFEEAEVPEGDASDYSIFTHEELVAECQNREISARGKSATLIARLEEHDGRSV